MFVVFPLIKMLPLSGFIIPKIILINVVLPAPESPNIPIVLFFCIFKSRFSKTFILLL